MKRDLHSSTPEDAADWERAHAPEPIVDRDTCDGGPGDIGAWAGAWVGACDEAWKAGRR